MHNRDGRILHTAGYVDTQKSDQESSHTQGNCIVRGQVSLVLEGFHIDCVPEVAMFLRLKIPLLLVPLNLLADLT